jgi:hypothetical protein
MPARMSRDSDEPQAKRAARAQEAKSLRQKRIVAEVPDNVHRQVRMRCLERGILVRDYILELLERDGIST